MSGAGAAGRRLPGPSRDCPRRCGERGEPSAKPPRVGCSGGARHVPASVTCLILVPLIPVSLIAVPLIPVSLIPVSRSRAPALVAFAEFWGDIAKEFYWKRQHTGPFLKYNFDVTKGKIFIEWMKGATTNICYNLLDRNVNEKKLGDKVAFYW